MKARDIALVLVVVVLVLVAFTFDSPIQALARGVEADARPAPLAAPIGTAFTYQGQLMDGEQPADGVYDFQFTLYDAETAGSPVGSTVAVEDVVVTGGMFSTELDFGASAFAGEARWLGIGVRPGESSDSYETLSPRQKVNPAPMAIHADTLDGLHGGDYALAGHIHSASEITTGTLASGRLSGSYTGITEVGTLGSLNVTGNTRIGGEYNYSAAKTRYYSLTATEFDALKPGVAFASFTGWEFDRYIASCNTNPCELVSAFHLPQGAVITGLTCTVMDNDPNISVHVRTHGVKPDGTGWSANCSITTSADSAALQIVSSSPCNHTVDNQTYAYGIVFQTLGGPATLCNGNPAGSNCRIYRCAISYSQTHVP